MKIRISAEHRQAWFSKAVCAGLSLFAFNGFADDRRDLVSSDATAIVLSDSGTVQADFDQFEEGVVEQVGLFEKVSSKKGSSSCDSCDGDSCTCEKPWWAHRTGGFGQFLLLRPGDTDIIYSVEQNDVVAGSFPTGPVGRVNIDEEPGFRVGFNLAASDCSSLYAAFTRWEGSTSDTIVAAPGNVLVSEILQPSVLTTGSSSLQDSADYSIDFNLVDLAYRRILKSSHGYAINWLAGFRYGNLEQDFQFSQDILGGGTGPFAVDTDIEFNGFGTMVGLDGECRSAKSGLSMYGRGIASFLAGDWRGSFVQTNQFTGGVVANDYEDYRITPVIELELGFGWTSKNNRFGANIGYLNSAWYNAITTRDYVEAVADVDFVTIDDTITFSGLTAGVQYSW